MTKWFFFEPVDTLFFRDGRPFDFGVETVAYTFFPPLPRTFYGALRTYLIFKYADLFSFRNDEKLKKVVGDETSFGNLHIFGPLLAISKDEEVVQVYYPLPQDICKIKDEDDLVLLKPRKDVDVTSNLGQVELWPVLPSDLTRDIEEVEGFLGSDFLENYLTEQELRKGIVTEIEKLRGEEHKIGIKLLKGLRVVDTGYLFSAPHIRLRILSEEEEKVGFLLRVEEDENLMPQSGELRLGGDTRVAKFFEVSWKEEKTKELVRKSLKGKKYFKLVLLTPAFFKRGIYPDFLNGNLEGKMPDVGIKVKLRGCVLGKPLPVGGFDLGHKVPKPKPIRWSVPPGSVYFFELMDAAEENWIDELLGRFLFQSILEGQLALEGFGYVLVGGW